jgi:hypothetical protein
MHVDFVKGMFVNGGVPKHMPPHCAGSCFWSSRTDVLLVVKIKARSYHALDPSFREALRSLPEVYDENDTLSWDNFFSVFPCFFTESALIGGKIEISSDTQQLEAKEVRNVLDELLHRGDAAQAEPFRQHSKDRVVVSGGDAAVLGGSLKGFSEAKHAQWVESLKRAPVVVGYNIRPVSDLIDFSASRKKAMQQAIAAHLHQGYKAWRKQVVIHDEIVKLMEGAKDSLHDEVKTLEQKKAEVGKLLEEQKLLIKECEEQEQKVQKGQERCRAEVLAFQKRLISCDSENLENENVFTLLYSCHTKKKIAGCDVDSRGGKNKQKQGAGGQGKRKLR